MSFTKSDSSSAISSIEECVIDLKKWMTKNKLQLNDSKTEVLFIRSKYDRSPIALDSINIGLCSVKPTTSVRNIGVTFDNTFSFQQHISNTSRSILFYLRKIGHIRRYLTTKSCQTLVHAVLSSKLDYGNSLLFGLPASHLAPLQRAQNLATSIITSSKKFDHITPVLKELHGLPVCYRIEFKLLLITYKCIHGLTPSIFN